MRHKPNATYRLYLDFQVLDIITIENCTRYFLKKVGNSFVFNR